MEEKEDFKPDSFLDATEQNLELSHLLNGSWRDYNIVTINRISIGSITGWLLIYRT